MYNSEANDARELLHSGWNPEEDTVEDIMRVFEMPKKQAEKIYWYMVQMWF